MDSQFLQGVIAVSIGALIPLLGNYFSQRREVKLKFIEKLIDKRVKAHEELFDVVLGARQVTSSKEVDNERNVIGYPSCLESEEAFIDFWTSSFFIIQKNAPWINQKLTRELSFFQDYIMTVRHNIQFEKTDELDKVRKYIKQDFIDIASRLESEIHNFLDTDIFKLKAKVARGWHKYPKKSDYGKVEFNLDDEICRRKKTKKWIVTFLEKACHTA